MLQLLAVYIRYRLIVTAFDSARYVGRLLAVEWIQKAAELVEQDAERPDIRLVLVLLHVEDLGCDIVRCADRRHALLLVRVQDG